MSCIFALCSGVSLFFVSYSEASFFRSILFILAAVFIQCRLLCNLFDGMVAVEGGLKSNSGEIYNDFPDRISDFFILVGAGYSIFLYNWAPVLGWIAATMAILTAYVRVLGVSTGAKQHFEGPMAKQHRMAIMTFACILSIFIPKGYCITVALLLIILGSFITVIRRLYNVVKELESK